MMVVARGDVGLCGATMMMMPAMLIVWGGGRGDVIET